MIKMTKDENLKDFLDEKVELYNRKDFIKDDPISIPHSFTKLQDIEIMAFWSATLAWGQRKTIINKCKVLVDLMDGTPHDFILNHQPKDLSRFEQFKHAAGVLPQTMPETNQYRGAPEAAPAVGHLRRTGNPAIAPSYFRYRPGGLFDLPLVLFPSI